MSLRKFKFKRTVQRLKRYRHITAVLMKHGLEEAAGTIKNKYSLGKLRKKQQADEQTSVKFYNRAARFRMALEELGPTFIKFGQLLSTRPDLIPPDYIEEFEKLLDQVPPEKSDRILTEIELQLGGKLEDIFSSFDRIPIAAGSIAQVHRATLKSGKDVVVKVRRPGIEETIFTECEILHDLAGLLKATLFDHENIDPQRIVEEFSEAVSKEVDLTNEKRNLMRFYREFESDPTIHIPEVFDDYCSESVLTMEYIDGIKPSDTDGIKQLSLDPKIIAQRGASFVLKQIFELGFFHADPHPGNFFLLPDNILAPIDFGQVAHLSANDRKLLKEVVLAVIENNPVRMVRALQRSDMTSDNTDTDKLTRDINLLFDSYHDLPLKEIPISKVIMQTFDIIRKNNVLPPAQFTLMLKSLITIESFALSLDPDFNIINTLHPYAKQLTFPSMNPKDLMRNFRGAVQDAGDLASKLPDDINAILSKFRQGNFQMKIHHEHLENLVKTLDKSSNRISFALIIAALLIGSSLLVAQQGQVLNLITLQSLGIIGYIAAAIIGLWLLISILRSRHY